MGQAQVTVRNDTFLFPRPVATAVAKDVLEKEKYKALDSLKTIRIDTLEKKDRVQSKLINNLNEQIGHYKGIESNYKIIDNNYRYLFDQMNRQNKNGQIVLFTTLGILAAVLIFKR